MIDLAVIPVAGRGVDLLPLTKSQPKEMLPVGRKPIVQHVVDELLDNHIHRLLFVTSSDKTSIENYFDTNKSLIWHLRRNGQEDLLAKLAFERNKAEYFYVRQRNQLGLGLAVLTAQSFVQRQRFVVALGDTILGRGQSVQLVKRMSELFDRSSGDISAILAIVPVEEHEIEHCGIVKIKTGQGDVFEIEDAVEKPKVEDALSNLAIAGRYIFSPDIFDYLVKTEPDKHGLIQLTDAVRLMLADGKKVLGVRLPSGTLRYDISNFISYHRTCIDFALHDEEYGNELQAYLYRSR